MSDLDISEMPSTWEFVNMFHDRRKQIYYCRLRRIEPTKNQNEWLEHTDAGATMQIAFNNAARGAPGHET